MRIFDHFKSKRQLSKETILIKPTKGLGGVDLKEIWRYRELLFFLAWRDIKVKYRQTVIGIMWALLQPLLTMVIFSIFFGKLAKIDSGGIPYPIFVFLGLLPWNYFAQSLTEASESIVQSANLVRKVYFPRVIIPMSSCLSAMTELLISFIILVFLMFFYGFMPPVKIFLLPFLIVLTFFCSLSFSLWLSALNVMYRDVRYAIPFFIRIGIFITPVIYPVKIMPEQYRWLLFLNPMAGIVEGFRALVLGGNSLPVFGLFMASAVILALFISGIYFFINAEKKFADII